MERYIGMDVHAARCTLAVISEKGRKLKDFPVETNGQALVEAVRMIPGHKQLVMEEGLQSAWLSETLRPHVDELVVAGIATRRGPKSDKRDAYGLAEKLRAAASHGILDLRRCNCNALKAQAISGPPHPPACLCRYVPNGSSVLSTDLRLSSPRSNL
jgi:hypothetical protein